MSIMANHLGKIDSICEKINECIIEVKTNKSLYELGSKAVYGMMTKIPDEAVTEDFVVHYIDKIYKLK